MFSSPTPQGSLSISIRSLVGPSHRQLQTRAQKTRKGEKWEHVKGHGVVDPPSPAHPRVSLPREAAPRSRTSPSAHQPPRSWLPSHPLAPPRLSWTRLTASPRSRPMAPVSRPAGSRGRARGQGLPPSALVSRPRLRQLQLGWAGDCQGGEAGELQGGGRGPDSPGGKQGRFHSVPSSAAPASEPFLSAPPSP